MKRLPEALAGMDIAALEAWFLSAVASVPPPVDDLLAVLEHLAVSGQRGLARSWSELLQEMLADQRLDHDALRLLRLRYGWTGESPEIRTWCETVTGNFRTRLGKAFAKAIRIDPEMPVRDFLERLEKLFTLAPGVLCHDSTWGFGVVKRLDDFYGKVTIDFSSKPRHEMSFAYASETLVLIDDGHLLARRHRDPEEIDRLVVENPAEVVRLALRSYGPQTADQLETLLLDGIVRQDEWKSFWSAARRELKTDSLVDFPVKRNAPITLLDAPRRYDTGWFAAVGELREPEAILESLRELEQSGAQALDGDGRAIVAERLEFLVWGDDGRRSGDVAQALLAADRWGLIGEDGRIGPRGITIDQALARLLAHDRAANVLDAVPARALPAFLELARRRLGDTLDAALVAALDRVAPGALDGVVGFMKDHGQGDSVRTAMALQARDSHLSPGQILWLLKSVDTAFAAAVLSPADLLMQAVDCMEREASGDMLRARNQIQALFEDGDWMSEQMQGLSGEQVELLMHRIRLSRGWDEIGRRTVMAGMIKAIPALANLLTTDGQKVLPSERGRFTSWRSYRERQAALKRLVEEEIPANAREIAVARGYGDLRENAEFKFAKEHQRILYRRRDEAEADLNAVQGTDFTGLPTDRAGMGTCVTLRHGDGREETFTILGEWDRDEDLGIISNQSALAQALEGHGPGDSIEIPSLAGSTVCTLKAVAELPETVRAWLSGSPETGR